MITLTKLHKGSIHSKVISSKRTFLPIDKKDLIFYVPMESKVGNTVYDESGKEDNGTVYGTTEAIGKISKALYFDGVDDKVTTPDNSDYNFTGDFTLEFWFKTADTYQEWGGIVSTCSPVGPNHDFEGWGVRFYSTSGCLGYNVGDTGNGTSAFQGTHHPSEDVWHHVVLTRSGMGTNNCKGYLDTDLDGQYTKTGIIYSGGNGLLMGKQWTSHYTWFYTGDLDEVKIYNRALSPTEILANYQKEV